MGLGDVLEICKSRTHQDFTPTRYVQGTRPDGRRRTLSHSVGTTPTCRIRQTGAMELAVNKHLQKVQQYTFLHLTHYDHCFTPQFQNPASDSKNCAAWSGTTGFNAIPPSRNVMIIWIALPGTLMPIIAISCNAGPTSITDKRGWPGSICLTLVICAM